MTQQFSNEVLEITPERATKLLSAIGAVPELRTLMQQAGMHDDDLIEGRTLLLDCLAAPRGPNEPRDTAAAANQRAAVATLDQWDEPTFARAKAALSRYFPATCDYLFDNLASARGADAVRGVATFLARLQTLETGKDANRSAHAQNDKRAVELLAKRGLTKEERERVGKLVDLALAPTPVLPKVETEGEAERRRQKLTSLKLWFDDWSATARTVVTKRNYLIRMGLASRHVAPTAADTDTTVLTDTQ